MFGMSQQRCQVTGATPSFGRSISHSHRRTSRRWKVNIQRKRYYVPSLRRTVTLNVSTTGIKVIARDGIDSVVAKILKRGERL